MEKYKMIVFDIDGTLVEYGSHVFLDEIKLMFKELKKKKYIVTLATGRDMVSIGDFHLQENVDYFIGANGSFILDLKTKKYLFNSYINFAQYEKFYNEFLINKMDDVYNIVLSDKEHAFVKNMEHVNSHWFWSPFIDKIKPIETAKNNIMGDQFHLITINCNDGDRVIKEAKEYFSSIDSTIDVQSYWHNGFFVANKNTSKSEAIKELTKHLSLGLDNVIAFGDGANDIDMIRTVGLGVAMENAIDELKEVAKETTKSVREIGTKHFLTKKGII